jgi:phage shock protein A
VGILSRFLQDENAPERRLDLVIEQMQADLAEHRQSLANLVATQKQMELQYSQANADANTFLRRAHLALQKGEHAAAREFLVQKNSQGGIATRLKIQLDQLGPMVDSLNKSLLPLEAKLADVQAKRDMLCVRLKAAKAKAISDSESPGPPPTPNSGGFDSEIPELGGSMSTGSAMTAFERMEDKLLQIDARSQASADLVGLDLEAQFALLEAGSNVYDELLELQNAVLGGSNNIQAGSVVDAELESLKNKLDQL